MLILLVWPKVITLSGFYCISIIASHLCLFVILIQRLKWISASKIFRIKTLFLFGREFTLRYAKIGKLWPLIFTYICLCSDKLVCFTNVKNNFQLLHGLAFWSGKLMLNLKQGHLFSQGFFVAVRCSIFRRQSYRQNLVFKKD